jgi:hypothetical protein
VSGFTAGRSDEDGRRILLYEPDMQYHEFPKDVLVSVDRKFQQELDALEVKCCHVHRGCTWFGELKDLEVIMAFKNCSINFTNQSLEHIKVVLFKEKFLSFCCILKNIK